MSEKIQQTNTSAKTSPLPNTLLFQANHLHMFKKGFKNNSNNKKKWNSSFVNKTRHLESFMQKFKPFQEIARSLIAK